jgi:hypothetical protein
VAALDKQRFHEVYRRVPSAKQMAATRPMHYGSEVDRSDTVLIPTILIPTEVAIQDMVAIDCPRLASAAEKARGVSPVLHVDRDEMTVDNLSSQLSRMSIDETRKSELLDTIRTQHDYDNAVTIAEDLGKRLPSEAEFDCMAASCTATEDSAPSANSDSEGDKHARDLDNLFTGLAEWTTTSGYRSERPSLVNSPDTRVVRGVASNMSTGAPDSDARHGRIIVPRFEQRLDIGFRCVRSPVPRFLDY